MTTEKYEGEDDFLAIAWMIRQGSSSWIGPTPRAGHARWAQKAPGRPAGLVHRGGLQAALFTAVVFFTVVAVAASMTPGGILAVPRTVSNVLSQRAPRPSVAPGSARPIATHQPAQSVQPAASPTAQTGVVAHSPTPEAEPPGDDGGGRGPGPPPAAGPSPSPGGEGPDD